MNKKFLITLIIILILIVLIAIFVLVIFIKQSKTPAITKEYIKQRFSQFKQAYQEKLEQGYDLTEVLTYREPVLDAYSQGDYELADKLLDLAFEALDKAEIPVEPIPQCPICPLPTEWSKCIDNKQTRINYKCGPETDYKCQSYTEERDCGKEPLPFEEIMRSNTWIRDKVTTFDFVPLGVTLAQHPDGSLHLPDAPALWYANNFAPFGMGTTKDGKHEIIYHNNLQVRGVKDKGNGATIRLSVDGSDWFTEFVETPVYYDETGTKFGTGFPTIYVEKGDFFAYISYDEDTRTWYYKLNHPQGYIDAVAEARSVPFWMGKPTGPYVVQGLYDSHEDLDLWGGYVDMADVITKSNLGEVERTYYGVMAMDREYHRQLRAEGSPGWKGNFSALSLSTDELDMILLQAVSPTDGSDYYRGVPLEHQGRINFYTRDKDFTFNGFEYSDDGKIPPETFYVKGSYGGGYIDLTGQSFKTFGWGEGSRGTWWDKNVRPYWGRCFILWNGTITLDGETIEIENAFGFSEFTRTEKPKSHSYIMDMPVFPEDTVPKYFQGFDVAGFFAPYISGVCFDHLDNEFLFTVGIRPRVVNLRFHFKNKVLTKQISRSDYEYEYSDGVLRMGSMPRVTIDYHVPHSVVVEIDAETSVTIDVRYRGSPLWYSKVVDEEDMLPMNPELLFGGYDAPIAVIVTLQQGDSTSIFYGYGVWENVWFLGKMDTYGLSDERWFLFNDPNFYGVLVSSRDKDSGETLIHTGRFGVEDSEAFRFDDFRWADDGSMYGPEEVWVDGVATSDLNSLNVKLHALPETAFNPFDTPTVKWHRVEGVVDDDVFDGFSHLEVRNLY